MYKVGVAVCVRDRSCFEMGWFYNWSKVWGFEQGHGHGLGFGQPDNIAEGDTNRW